MTNKDKIKVKTVNNPLVKVISPANEMERNRQINMILPIKVMYFALPRSVMTGKPGKMDFLLAGIMDSDSSINTAPIKEAFRNMNEKLSTRPYPMACNKTTVIKPMHAMFVLTLAMAIAEHASIRSTLMLRKEKDVKCEKLRYSLRNAI